MIAASNTLPRSVWRWIFLCLIAAGALGSLFSLLTVKNAALATSGFPWGIVAALDVFCGLAVSAGAFGIAAAGYVVHDAAWGALIRPSLLLGSCGYVVALLGAFSEIASPRRAWPLVIQFVSSRSVVAGCVWVLAVLALWAWLEFAPARKEAAERTGTWLHRVLILFAAFATVLTNYQQAHLASLLVKAGTRLSPLWSSPRLPVLFFISSVCAGLAVLLFAGIRAKSSFPVFGITKALALFLFLYLALRLNDVVEIGALRLTVTGAGASFFWAEIVLLMGAVASLCDPKPSVRTVYIGTAMALAGVLLNRLNSCITALEYSMDTSYHVGWAELSVAYSLAAVGIAMYVVGAKFLEVFPGEADTEHSAVGQVKVHSFAHEVRDEDRSHREVRSGAGPGICTLDQPHHRR